MDEKKDKAAIPDTGISGVYELFYTTDDVGKALDYFSEFGFSLIAEASFSKEESLALYGHDAACKAWRLQSGEVDTHGLIRLLKWDYIKSNGVGYVPPRTVGQRIAVMKTADIFRLRDIFQAERDNGEKWTVTEPVADDLFGLNTEKDGVFSKPIIVRENAVYGEFFNHIFFQRYGYHIEGYGTINPVSPMQTSEFTHHDFFIDAQDMNEMGFMSSALGLLAEEPVKLDGEWLKGPREVFMLNPGESHWYQGFVSPNNICGKLKFFIPTTPTANKTFEQSVGSLGLTMHSFYTDKLTMVHQLVSEHELHPTEIQKNEFGELCFTFTGNGKCHWQILAKSPDDFKNKVETTLEITIT